MAQSRQKRQLFAAMQNSTMRHRQSGWHSRSFSYLF